MPSSVRCEKIVINNSVHNKPESTIIISKVMSHSKAEILPFRERLVSGNYFFTIFIKNASRRHGRSKVTSGNDNLYQPADMRVLWRTWSVVEQLFPDSMMLKKALSLSMYFCPGRGMNKDFTQFMSI